MVRKYPILWDMIFAITGSFIKFEADQSEEGLVFPIYTPLNSYRSLRFPISIPESSIHKIIVPSKGIKGAQQEIVIITGDAKGESLVGDLLKDITNKQVTELREANQNLRIELMKDKQRAREKVQESKKQLQEDSLSPRRENPLGFTEHSRFGDDFSDRRGFRDEVL